jgi:hypothetical protein
LIYIQGLPEFGSPFLIYETPLAFKISWRIFSMIRETPPVFKYQVGDLSMIHITPPVLIIKNHPVIVISR